MSSALAALFFAGKDWLGIAGLLALAALGFVAWSYVRTPAPRGLRLGCAGLKLLGFATLLVCLLEPMWSGERAKPGANLFAVVVDDSLSLNLHDPGASTSRADAVRATAHGATSLWRGALAQTFELRNYVADDRLRSVRDFAELKFDGTASALGETLRQLAERHRGQPLAGAVLLTDGIASDFTDPAELHGLPPIYPVVFGKDAPPADLAIANAAATQSAFEDAPLAIQAEVSGSGFRGREVVAKVTAISADPSADAEKPIAEQTLRVPADADQLTFRWQLRPEKSGVLFYRIHLAAKDADAPEEATQANNETVICVDRKRGPHRVLYVAGRPNWEYKFLHRAVEGDRKTQLAGLIRIAKREPKFEFRGRSGESSNPLFRGFGAPSAEETERYDQPVLVRLNVDDPAELRGGFPKTAEELFKYEAVILDDLEADFFKPDELTLVQRFVSERGGSLMMLGGAESFVQGGFQRTAIGEMLPVYLDAAVAEAAPEAWHLALTREGWLQPWARLRANEADENQRLSALPGFDVFNHAGRPKPAATVVANLTDGHEQQPALVTQQFGRGRTAAFLVGDFWQSGLGDEARMKDLTRAWRQIVRWLVADVPTPVEISVEPQPHRAAMRLRVRVRDAKFQPLENATVALQITPVGENSAGQPVEMAAEAAASEPGVYEATYLPRASGGFRVTAKITDENGVAAGIAEAGWATDFAAAEFRTLVPQRALMEKLAQQTGGRVLAPEELANFARDLPARSAPITEIWTRPLWQTPAMFLFAVICLAAEWGVRRWKGLA